MTTKIVTIFDTKANAFNKPVFVQSYAAAVRSFTDAVNDASTEFFKHPEDYIMFGLGEYDENTAIFTLETPIELAKAIALKGS